MQPAVTLPTKESSRRPIETYLSLIDQIPYVINDDALYGRVFPPAAKWEGLFYKHSQGGQGDVS